MRSVRAFRYALRVLARAPGFTIAVVLILAAGVGANSAVFSVLDAALLEPLPFPDADRLVQLSQTRTDGGGGTFIAPARLADWNRESRAFEAITGYYTDDLDDRSADPPERLHGAFVAPRFFDVLGIAPALGRGFAESEHRAGGAQAVIISDRYWRKRFEADPNIIGTAVRLGSEPRTIVGVMPASFAFPSRDIDVWWPVPSVGAPAVPGIDPRAYSWFTGIGRLEPNTTVGAGRSDLELVQARLAKQYPDTDRGIGVDAIPLKETVVGSVRGSLWLVFGAVSVLLLIGCTNIAALQLARAARRAHEISVRFSLGASRANLVGQMLVEAAILVAAGAALGVLVADGLLKALRSLAQDLPRFAEVRLDADMLLYTLAAAIVVTLLAGLLPALRGTMEAGSAARSSRGEVAPRHALQWGLVGVQVALSVTLLGGAGLLLRSFEALSHVEPGFDPSHVLTFSVSGNYAETTDYDRLVRRINDTLDGLSAVPGVESSASTMLLPGVHGDVPREFHLEEGRAADAPPMIAESRFVSPGYFATLRIPLLEGELCRRPDRSLENGDAEIMINRSFADRYLAGRPAVGLHLVSPGAGGVSARIAGVVGDARETGIDRSPVPVAYVCFSAPGPTPSFLVRTAGDPLAVAGAVRAKIKELEPLRAVYAIAPLEERIDAAFAQNRLRTLLLGLFAAAALVLACFGVYATLSYVASLRRREAGLRIALGAPASRIVAEFLLKALRVVGAACVAGLVLSLAVGRALSGMLFGVSPSDPATLAGVVAFVIGVAAAAALLPAMRASRVEPMRVLREE